VFLQKAMGYILSPVVVTDRIETENP